VSSSSACVDIAAETHTKLVWTGTALSTLMEWASKPEVGFAGNSEGVLVFPQLLAAPDGLMTFCKALELVATRGRPLSDLVDGLPEVCVARREVRTPWALKGAVMREVAAAARPGELVLLDGVKVVEGDRWALVIPDPDRPVSRVWAEAPTHEDSAALADRFATLVERVVAQEGAST
jgi:phosphomannomutase